MSALPCKYHGPVGNTSQTTLEIDGSRCRVKCHVPDCTNEGPWADTVAEATKLWNEAQIPKFSWEKSTSFEVSIPVPSEGQINKIQSKNNKNQRTKVLEEVLPCDHIWDTQRYKVPPKGNFPGLTERPCKHCTIVLSQRLINGEVGWWEIEPDSNHVKRDSEGNLLN